MLLSIAPPSSPSFTDSLVELYRNHSYSQHSTTTICTPLLGIVNSGTCTHAAALRQHHPPPHPSYTTPHRATAMSSQPPALIKTASNPKQIPGASSTAPSVSTTQAFFSNTNGGVRANSSTRNATPRNSQVAKPKHKSKSKASYRLVDEDAEAEMASMQNPNGRRGQQSITHLMNFALPPRPQSHTHQFRHGGRRGERRNQTWGLGSGYHATDKAR